MQQEAATADHAHVRTGFLHFAGVCEGQSPLYVFLSSRIADEPSILALASGAQARQPPPNLLLGAVHFLLLSGVSHELAAFYPSLGGQGDPSRAWPAFVDFCGVHAREIAEIVSSRRVQTNEVGRCGVLLPAFAAAHAQAAQPLHLIDVGASAGLNLLFDHYRYEYSDGRRAGAPSPVAIRTELRGSRSPADLRFPPVTGRVGIDLRPVNVSDAAAMRWLEALIWPDQVDRILLHRHAARLAAASPPRVVRGDGIERLPALMAEASPESVPCVFHSHAIYQMTREWRASFDQVLDHLGRSCPLVHVSLEWLGDDPGPRLHMTSWCDGKPDRRRLADCHHHGRWLEWLI